MKKRFVVVKRTFFKPETKEKVLELTKRTLPAYRRQSGLVDLKNFISLDATHVITVITWKDKDSFENSRHSKELLAIKPKWDELENYLEINIEQELYLNI